MPFVRADARIRHPDDSGAEHDRACVRQRLPERARARAARWRGARRRPRGAAGEARMHKSRGFSLVELMVVVIAVGILAGALLERVLPLVGRAQRTAFVQVRVDLQTALLLEAAERITRGEATTLPNLAQANPMTLLLSPPANYLGSFARPPDDVPAASWYFDQHSRRLVYRVGRYARFDAP